MSDPSTLFLNELESLLNDCQRRVEEGTLEENSFEYSRRRLEYFISVLDEAVSLQPSHALSILLQQTRPWLSWLDAQPIIRSVCCSNPASVHVETAATGRPGRPAFDIPKETLEYLRDTNFTWVQISQMFGVSITTITRRVREFRIWQSQNVNQISNAELRNHIELIHRNYPHAGCRMVRGILTSRGLRVTVQRIHDTLAAVDPMLTAQRWGAVVHRRTYCVKGANSLWHVDGHHSLIRWGFVVHGGKAGWTSIVLQLIVMVWFQVSMATQELWFFSDVTPIILPKQRWGLLLKGWRLTVCRHELGETKVGRIEKSPPI